MKITSKQFSGYIIANKKWISDNDNYNIEYFGITKEEYYKISKAINDIYGLFGIIGKPNLSEINKRLEGMY